METQPVTAEQYDVIIIGGSQAGLAMSYWLSHHQIDHVVLERGRLAENWRSKRRDSFTIVTPNSFIRRPGRPYEGDNPDGYMPRDEFVAHLERYAAQIRAPIRCGEHVRALRRQETDCGFWVDTEDASHYTQNVVVATGILQLPRIPQQLSERVPSDIRQFHSSEYQNPGQLPDGAVLVVGTGQSGCQIAEDLTMNGRKVFLSVGKTGRIPRRYRGKDAYFWVGHAGLYTSTPDKFSNHAHVSGVDGEHELNLYQFARNGITLVGRLQDISGETLQFAPDIQENLAYADEFELNYCRQIDEYIDATGLDAPLQVGDRPRPVNRFEGGLLTELNLSQENIRTIIWSTGYRYDFRWVDIPIFDASGFPQQERGVTSIPGLYFLGMNWRTLPRSAFISSVGSEAEVVANHILTRKTIQEGQGQ